MYNGNRYLLGFLFLYLAAQTAAGLWQYTVPGGTPAPDPVDNYEYHCRYYIHSRGHEAAADDLHSLYLPSPQIYVRPPIHLS